METEILWFASAINEGLISGLLLVQFHFQHLCRSCAIEYPLWIRAHTLRFFTCFK